MTRNTTGGEDGSVGLEGATTGRSSGSVENTHHPCALPGLVAVEPGAQVRPLGHGAVGSVGQAVSGGMRMRAPARMHTDAEGTSFADLLRMNPLQADHVKIRTHLSPSDK